MTQQISLTIPKNLFNASKEYYQELGYKNIQEFILDLMRKKVILENLERYTQIESRMKTGKGVKKLDQKQAIEYIKGL
ncbi:hypothetical protein J4403_03450 [Candidatus Woesearchaeota archaeon]|nr:hypothetical protein [Candidatus Woesearchaeota archaeon]